MKIHLLQPLIRQCKKLRYEQLWIGAVILCITIGLTLPAGATHAETATTVINYFLLAIAHLLNWIINMLGNLLIMIVDLVIQVAQYNTFTKAPAVLAGWPLVRDVTNMFFIVVLLVTAFSTIVRWSKFDYKKILPKMLLMAVLINFSLPLLGLCIDFSQIIMLTFVNAFKAAAGGNFITALKLNKIMEINNSGDYAQQLANSTDTQLHQLLAAEMLGVMIMGLSTTIVAIMLVYLIGRIVGLWIALIMSPAAFFVTAMPSNISGKVSSLDSGYWSKFGSLLTGGPIMAFFLWLTLATVANGGLSVTTAPITTQAGETQQVNQYFATSIGTADQFGSYIVALALMFMGLGMAVEASNAVSSKLGGAAGKIRGYGVGASKFLAYGGMAAGGALAVRGAGRAAGGVGNFVDRRANLTTRIGGGIQRLGVATGISSVARAGRYVATTRKRAVERQEEKMEKNMEGMKPKDQLKILEGVARRGNPDQKKAADKKIIKRALGTKAGQEYFEEKHANDAVVKGLKGSDKPEDIAKLSAYTQQKRDEELREKLTAYEKNVVGNEDEEKWIRETREKVPSLAANPEEFVREEMGKNQESFRKFRGDQLQGADVLTGIISGADGLFEGNKINDLSMVGKAMKGGSMRAKLLQAQTDRILEAAKSEGLTAEEFVKDQALVDKHKIGKGRYAKVMADSADGTKKKGDYELVSADAFVQTAAGAAGAGTAPAQVAPRVARNEELIHHDLQDVEALLAQLKDAVANGQPTAPIRVELENARRNVLENGGTVEEAYDMRGQRFQSNEDRSEFMKQIGGMQGSGKADVKMYETVNMQTVSKNEEGRNEAREALVEQVSVADLSKAFADAKAGSHKVAVANIEDMARAIHTQAQHVHSSIDEYNKRIKASNDQYVASVGGQANADPKKLGIAVDKAAIIDALKKNDTTALTAALDQVKTQTKFVLNASDVKALNKQEQLKAEPNFNGIASTASPRADEVLRREKERRQQKRGTP